MGCVPSAGGYCRSRGVPLGMCLDGEVPSLGRRAAGRDNDVHVASKCTEEADQPLDGEAGELASHQGRHLGLIDTQHLGGLGLSEGALFDETVDLEGELCFGVRLLRLGYADVGKDVAAADF